MTINKSVINPMAHGGANWGNVPTPETEKIVVDNNLPMVYTFGEEAAIQDICSKNYEKSQCSMENLIKNLRIDSNIFRVSSFVLQTRKVFHAYFLTFPVCCLLNFYTTYSRLSP